jgi:hypothetical protein
MMSTARSRARRVLGSVILVLAAIGFALPASAEGGDDDCPTWLPDFKCDRKARFDGMVQPMSMPFIFEDPFITTGANLVGIWNRAKENGDFQEADIGVLALQLRVALTDRLALIATKDGFTMINYDTKIRDIQGAPPSRAAVLPDDSGFMNMTLGFKYAMIVDEENRFILSPAIRYEIPLGNDEVLQGHGDGIFIPSASFAWGPVDNLNFIGGLGGHVPVNSDKQSTNLFYNMHVQYNVLDWLVPFVELSGIHWTNSGNGKMKLNTGKNLGVDLPLSTAQAALRTGPFEGAEVANLGSERMRGEDLLTMAWGLRFPVADQLVLGISYERGLAGRDNLFDQRITTMATFEY